MVISLLNVAFATSKLNIPTVDTSKKVYDFADLLTTAEEDNLYNSITEFIANYDLDMAIVTTLKNSTSAMRYAEDFYDYNGFGTDSTNDGIIFLIDMDNREMYIATTGMAQLIYDDYRINKILDATYDEITTEDYYGCAGEFVRLSGEYASIGIPNSNKYADIDLNGDYYVSNTHRNGGISFEIAFVIAGIITLIFMIITLSKHRMIKKASEAKHYLKDIRITNRVDSFLHTHTSKVYIPPANTSSGGGSSTHHGSSGVSHGGGGRRF